MSITILLELYYKCLDSGYVQIHLNKWVLFRKFSHINCLSNRCLPKPIFNNSGSLIRLRLLINLNNPCCVMRAYLLKLRHWESQINWDLMSFNTSSELPLHLTGIILTVTFSYMWTGRWRWIWRGPKFRFIICNSCLTLSIFWNILFDFFSENEKLKIPWFNLGCEIWGFLENIPTFSPYQKFHPRNYIPHKYAL